MKTLARPGPNTITTFFDPDAGNSNHRASSVRASAFTLGSQASSFVLRIISTVVLARLLTPANFGLIAMVFALINVALLFKDAGLNDATLQRDTVTHDQVSTLFWIGVAFGTIVALAVASVSPLIAWFYGEPALIGVTVALAPIFVFSGFTSQHQALLRRKMQFGRLAVVHVAASAASVTVAVVAGLMGAGYWALVLMHTTLAIVTAAGCWIAMPWIPGRLKRGVGVRSMIHFGANVTGFNLANYLSRNADNVLIGKFIGANALGFYNKAYGLLALPLSQIRTPITSVGLPVLSRLQNEPDRYRAYYIKLLDSLLFAIAPTGLLLAVHSPEVILLVLGDQWTPVSVVFRILAVSALPQAALGTLGMVMMSSGRTKRFFRLGIFGAVGSIVSFVVGLPWGINGVALSYAIATVLSIVPLAAYGLNGTPIRLGDFLRAGVIPFVAAVSSSLLSRVSFVLLTPFMSMPFALAVALFVAGAAHIGFYAILPRGRGVLADLWKSVISLNRRAK